ncbi:MAG: 7,8-didemethyl-8-hydroxy-5-deazariboflavin synthase subunit CofG [Candidatus Hermodarchaeota archaeon]
MDEISSAKDFKKLTLKEIKEKVKLVKDQLPDDEKKVITYSKNFTLSLSNYCVNQCGYCYYNYKIPKSKGGINVILLNIERIAELSQKALQYNCKEALLMSGERSGSFYEVKKELEKLNYSDLMEYLKEICTYLLDFQILPHINLGFLTYNEMKELKNFTSSMGLMLESTCMDLFNKGKVHEHSIGKLPEKRIEHITNAGKLKIPFTTGLLVGIGEHFEDIISDLLLIKSIHDKYNHIQEVIIQNFVKKDGIPYQPKNLISFQDMLKITGIARIIFKNDIAIQVPPNLITGLEKKFIEMGIDDFGGISPFTIDYINPDNQWPQIDKLLKICKDNDYNLKERLPVYDKYIRKESFCPENIKKVINNMNLDVEYSKV